MRRERIQKAERLEKRMCLTAAAAVENGDLVFAGEGDGDAAIVAVGDAVDAATVDKGIAVSVRRGAAATNAPPLAAESVEAVDRAFANFDDARTQAASIEGQVDRDTYVGSREQVSGYYHYSPRTGLTFQHFSYRDR